MLVFFHYQANFRLAEYHLIHCRTKKWAIHPALSIQFIINVLANWNAWNKNSAQPLKFHETPINICNSSTCTVKGDEQILASPISKSYLIGSIGPLRWILNKIFFTGLWVAAAAVHTLAPWTQPLCTAVYERCPLNATMAQICPQMIQVQLAIGNRSKGHCSTDC